MKQKRVKDKDFFSENDAKKIQVAFFVIGNYAFQIKCSFLFKLMVITYKLTCEELKFVRFVSS